MALAAPGWKAANSPCAGPTYTVLTGWSWYAVPRLTPSSFMRRKSQNTAPVVPCTSKP